MATNLKDMAADKNNGGVKKTDLYKIDPRQITEESGFNIRDYDNPDVEAHIESITEAMLNGAFIPPITVRTDGTGAIYLIDGHCRHKAALRAIERGAEGLMLTAVNFRGSDVERIELMLRSGEGLKFMPLEIAKGYLRLKRMNISTADIAKSVGKSLSHVEQYLTLATSNHDVQQMVEKGEVSATVAIQAVRKNGENAGKALKAIKEANGGEKVTDKAFKPTKAKINAVLKAVEAVHEKLKDVDFSATSMDDIDDTKPYVLVSPYEATIDINTWGRIAALLDVFEEMNNHG